MRICGLLGLDTREVLRKNLAGIKGKEILNFYLKHPGSSFIVIGDASKSVTIWNNFNIKSFNKDQFQASYGVFHIGEDNTIINSFNLYFSVFQLSLSFSCSRTISIYDITSVVKGREIDNNLVNEIKSLFPK